MLKQRIPARSLGVAVLLLGAVAISSEAMALSPFQATYQFSYNGKNMGSATRSLKQNGNNWTYVFAAKAGILASATETSHFSLIGNNVVSNSFSRNASYIGLSDTLKINFNPAAKTITTNRKGKARSFAWKTGALDELNAEIQIREDLQKSGLKNSYLLTDAKGVDARRFIKLGNENLVTPYGTLSTIKVKLEHGKAERNTIFWLAPKLDYLPVKVAHNDGSSSYGILLTGYQGPTK
ncbi:DUF3108 domain-containing protein [Acinetobacter brisouii]|uniref:DUF3108 domain-containing protein n=1 Tax=Acinetobacter brisouii TaxID=396323 RepID=UPI00124C4034|nr:DUF3108 domain-containing protein [Acinetobacter brisouii]